MHDLKFCDNLNEKSVEQNHCNSPAYRVCTNAHGCYVLYIHYLTHVAGREVGGLHSRCSSIFVHSVNVGL